MTKRNALAKATMTEKAETNLNSNIWALGTIIKTQGREAEHSYGHRKSLVSHLTKLAIDEPLSAFVEVTEALQPSFECGFTLGLEEAYDTIRRIPLENRKLTRDERQLLIDTVFDTPDMEKTKTFLTKLTKKLKV